MVLILLISGALFAQSTPPVAENASGSGMRSSWGEGGPAQSQPGRFQHHLPRRAAMYYQGIWGVDSLRVRVADSGELIRFGYRVLDAQKAKVLNDKKVEPSLIDLQAGVKLKIPEMQNIGKLRQSSTPEVGKSYWMAFSNNGGRVKRGDRVEIIIGNFQAEGLIIE
jgi:hypothetical protein